MPYIKSMKNKYVENQPGELISEVTMGDIHRKTFLISVKETEDCVIRKLCLETRYASTGEVFKADCTERQQKFLCVNGLRKGDKITEKEAHKNGYFLYNRSTKTKPGEFKPPTAVLVDLSLMS